MDVNEQPAREDDIELEVVPEATLQPSGNVKSRRSIQNCQNAKKYWKKKKNEAVVESSAESLAESTLAKLKEDEEAFRADWIKRTFAVQVRMGRLQSADGLLLDDHSSKRSILKSLNSKSRNFAFTDLSDALAEVAEMFLDGRLVFRDDVPARPAVLDQPATGLSSAQPLVCTTVYGKGKAQVT
jgi:hypothetical protein